VVVWNLSGNDVLYFSVCVCVCGGGGGLIGLKNKIFGWGCSKPVFVERGVCVFCGFWGVGGGGGGGGGLIGLKTQNFNCVSS